MANYDTFRYGCGARYGTLPAPSDSVVTIAYDFLSDTNLSYQRMKKWLVDNHIYDLDQEAEPYHTTPYSFRGIASANNRIVNIYRNDVFVGTVTAAPDGTFSFDIPLILGENTIQCTVLRSSDLVLISSNIIYINTYNLYLWLASYSSEFSTLWSDLQDKTNNVYLDQANSVGVKSNFENFSVVPYREGDNILQYRASIRAALDSHYESTTWFAVLSWLEQYVSKTPQLVEYFTTTHAPMTTAGKLYVDRIVHGTPTLIVNWNGIQIYINGGLYKFRSGTLTLADNEITTVYVDGTLGSDGYLVVYQTIGVVPTGSHVLGVVTTASGDITAITGCKRISLDAVQRSSKGRGHKFEVLLDGTGISSTDRTVIVQMLNLLKPVHKLGMLKFSDETYARTF